MIIKYNSNLIKINKELNDLDKFTINFTNVLNKLNIKYVIVSGYVAILFGRSRNSEDIDIIIEKINFDQFVKLWDELYKNKFECILTEDLNNAYHDYVYLNDRLRFAKKNTFIPNMELKCEDSILERWVLDNSLKVKINNEFIFISNIELQIAYKLYLSSEKDIEDARYLYKLFLDKINIDNFNEWILNLKVKEKYKKYLL